MKTVLVTGSSGYIGKHLVKMLKQTYEVFQLDMVIPDDHRSLGDTYFEADICYEAQLEDYMLNMGDFPTHFDTVIHLAALVRVGESVKNPFIYYDTNVNGTVNVLNSFSFDNFIFASTGVAENPVNPYALSKRIAEDIVAEHCEIRNTPYTTFRFYNVIGSDGIAPTNLDGLMYNLMKAQQTGNFNLYGIDYNTKDGTAVRDYVHVNDICRAIEKAVEEPANGIENLGTGVGHTVMEMVDTYMKVNGCIFALTINPRRDGDLERSVLDNVSPYMVNSYTLRELMKV